jgi:hypothetical protein
VIKLDFDVVWRQRLNGMAKAHLISPRQEPVTDQAAESQPATVHGVYAASHEGAVGA